MYWSVVSPYTFIMIHGYTINSGNCWWLQILIHPPKGEQTMQTVSNPGFVWRCVIWGQKNYQHRESLGNLIINWYQLHVLDTQEIKYKYVQMRHCSKPCLITRRYFQNAGWSLPTRSWQVVAPSRASKRKYSYESKHGKGRGVGVVFPSALLVWENLSGVGLFEWSFRTGKTESAFGNHPLS